MRGRVRIKSSDDIKRIRECGKIIYDLFSKIKVTDLAGLSTWDIDTFIEDFIVKNRARPAFKTVKGYGFASCVSVNNVASHGVPSKKCRLKKGDIVKIDTGTVMNGYFADSCSTFVVGEADEDVFKLVKGALGALLSGISQMHPGNKIGDIGFAVESYVMNLGYSVVKNFTGHGVGYALHEPPVVPGYGDKGQGIPLKEGMVMTVEPIVNQGSDVLVVLEDGWTSITADGKLSAQFEHTIAITGDGPLLLTSGF
jgi:methionyl aminopeptidase